jgi:hypothetical protein
LDNHAVDFADLLLITDHHLEDTDQHDGTEHGGESYNQQAERPASGRGSVAEAPTWARTQAVLSTWASKSGGVAELASERRPSRRWLRSISS